MSYARMNHAEWLERYLRRELTSFQAKVADIIGMVANGIYNAPVKWKSATLNMRFVRIVWQGELATWDSDGLTKLVFLAHEARIRVSIQGCGPRYTEIIFHPRVHDGCIGRRHPNIDEAVTAFREYLPADHRIIYAPAKEHEA